MKLIGKNLYPRFLKHALKVVASHWGNKPLMCMFASARSIVFFNGYIEDGKPVIETALISFVGTNSYLESVCFYEAAMPVVHDTVRRNWQETIEDGYDAAVKELNKNANQ